MVDNMNILIAINKEYITPAKTMLRSLIDTNRGAISVYILNYELEKKDICNIKKNINRDNVEICDIRIENKIFEKYYIPEQFSVEIFIRLIAYQVLPPDVDKILWLDSDMIILNDISELYKSRFDGRMMVVCKDIGCYESGVMEERRERLDNSEMKEYFNSGMLLMNLKKMRDNFNIEKVFEILNKKDIELIYPDQDILNMILWDDVKYADDNIYNKQVFSYQNYDVNALRKNSNILHYVGKIKPWNFRYEGSAKKLYYNELKKVDRRAYSLIRLKRILFRIKWFLSER